MGDKDVAAGEYVCGNSYILRERVIDKELKTWCPPPIRNIICKYNGWPPIFMTMFADDTTRIEVPHLCAPAQQHKNAPIAPSQIGLIAVRTGIKSPHLRCIKGELYIKGKACIHVVPVRPAHLVAKGPLDAHPSEEEAPPAVADSIVDSLSSYGARRSAGYEIEYPPIKVGYRPSVTCFLSVSAPPMSWDEERAAAGGRECDSSTTEDRETEEELWMSRSLQSVRNSRYSCMELWRRHGGKWSAVFDADHPLESIFGPADQETVVVVCASHGGTSGSWVMLRVRNRITDKIDNILYNVLIGKWVQLAFTPPLMAGISCPLSRRGCLHPFAELITEGNKDSPVCRDENCTRDGALLLGSASTSSFAITILDCNGRTAFCSGGNEYRYSHRDCPHNKDVSFRNLGFDRHTGTVFLSFSEVALSYSLHALLKHLFATAWPITEHRYADISLTKFLENAYVHDSSSLSSPLFFTLL